NNQFCCHEVSGKSTDNGRSHRTVEIETSGDRFRIVGSEFSTVWLPDTFSNRKAMLIFLRLLQDKANNLLYTHQELSVIVDSKNRQASSRHIEHFRATGEDMLAFLTRQRKVDKEVVSAVLLELRKEPLAEVNEICELVKRRLGREDIREWNIETALSQIPYSELRGVIRQRLSKGKAHYREEYLLLEMMGSFSSERGKQAGITVPEVEERTILDPTAIQSLLTPGVPLSSIKKPLQMVSFLWALYHHGVSLSVLGKWCYVDKTTVLRWIVGLGLEIWPLVSEWIKKQVKATMVYIDEKWLKIQGKWHYWFVVLEAKAGLPILTSLLDSRGKWACEWIGAQLKMLGQIARVFIRDGMAGYEYIREALGKCIKHLLCHFHYQEATSRWVKKQFDNGGEEEKEVIKERKKELKKVLQTDDKRTAKRRFGKLKENEKELGIQGWIENTEKILPNLLPAIGSKKFPKTNNVIERFFRNFNQFYKKRCGFSSVGSAKRGLLCFLVMYLFLQQPGSGKAPLEVIMPQVKDMPFYRLVNDPLGCLLGLQNVNRNKKMARNEVKQCLGP
ncbi:MAG: hypothetical protein AB1414_03755, partial [bacterium]